jgi:transitional endoplasmic reticulum ATPase
MELCREAGLNAFRRRSGHKVDDAGPLLELLEGVMIEAADFDTALGKIRPSALREVTVTTSDIGWDEIGGLEDAKEQLRELVQMPLLHPEALASMNIRPPSGVLLYGEPGTGKTVLAKALAKECHANFISVKGSEIFSKWVGESEAEIRSIFQLAYRVAPAIIFFDHIDAIAPRRGREANVQAAERVVSQLLSEMDSIPAGSRLVVVARPLPQRRFLQRRIHGLTSDSPPPIQADAQGRYPVPVPGGAAASPPLHPGGCFCCLRAACIPESSATEPQRHRGTETIISN